MKTTPELLFRKRPYLSTADLYINRSGLYFPQTGNEGVPVQTMPSGNSPECSRGRWEPNPSGGGRYVGAYGCRDDQVCNAGTCFPPDNIDDWFGDGVEIGWQECGSLGEVDATGRPDSVYLDGYTGWAPMKPDTIGTGNSIYIPGGWDVVWHNGEGWSSSDQLNSLLFMFAALGISEKVILIILGGAITEEAALALLVSGGWAAVLAIPLAFGLDSNISYMEIPGECA